MTENIHSKSNPLDIYKLRKDLPSVLLPVIKMIIIRVTKNSLHPNVDLQAHKMKPKRFSVNHRNEFFAHIKKKRENPAYFVLRARSIKI